ncbi:IS66 family insertion sequence element accessory protein TnpA [Lutispora saccharofermentans]|uniref:Transposase n=1 Tax=Lutispora saccharofermentans TaxID=3024236 RepID=A0ABT1ND22_9FIRM|nr:hypothetical protein [Lutispora saccharofermentans]MCQ1529147.1 hypothetical protein [Lutispora saccharofermentans]
MNYKENRELWVTRVASFRESGMNQSQWCKANEIKLSALGYWLRKLNSRDDSGAEAGIFEFASLNVPDTCSAKSIILEFGAVKIHLNTDFDEKLLLKTIRTLQQL